MSWLSEKVSRAVSEGNNYIGNQLKIRLSKQNEEEIQTIIDMGKYIDAQNEAMLALTKQLLETTELLIKSEKKVRKLERRMERVGMVFTEP